MNINKVQNFITHSVAIGSEYYPPRLREIRNPPSVLYARGNIELLLKDKSAAVVGTRDASTNGLKITDRITRFLVEKNCVIVSGLALGIDQQAHASCISADGETIAVLAHGLDRVAPSQNTSLAHSILQSNGLLVSEHPDGVAPAKHFFVLRNRIQVGLSKYSVIVESSVSSGTTSHAKFCIESGHALFAVLPEEAEALKVNSSGPRMMVQKMGAIPLRNRNDYVLLENHLRIDCNLE